MDIGARGGARALTHRRMPDERGVGGAAFARGARVSEVGRRQAIRVAWCESLLAHRIDMRLVFDGELEAALEAEHLAVHLDGAEDEPRLEEDGLGLPGTNGRGCGVSSRAPVSPRRGWPPHRLKNGPREREGKQQAGGYGAANSIRRQLPPVPAGGKGRLPRPTRG